MTSFDDLSVLIENTVLNIRVVVLVQTPKGYIFEKSQHGYYFAIGGRVKINESTEEAATRELFEEIQLENVKVNLVGIVENFFKLDGIKGYHEINIIYKTSLEQELDLKLFESEGKNEGFVYIEQKDFDTLDIRPKALIKVIESEKEFVHLVNREL